MFDWFGMNEFLKFHSIEIMLCIHLDGNVWENNCGTQFLLGGEYVKTQIIEIRIILIKSVKGEFSRKNIVENKYWEWVKYIMKGIVVFSKTKMKMVIKYMNTFVHQEKINSLKH